MAQSTRTVYNDFYFRLIISLLGGHFIVVFGEKPDWSELLLSFEYYISVLASSIIAFIIITMIRTFTMRLDRHYGWTTMLVPRLFLQLLLGVVVTGIVAFFLAALHFKLIGVDILETVYLQFDFPVIILMLVLINFYYYCYYLHLKTKKIEEEPDRQVFIVNRGIKNIPLFIDEISYFFREGEANFIRTFEGNDFLVTQSLDEIQQQVGEKNFLG